MAPSTVIRISAQLELFGWQYRPGWSIVADAVSRMAHLDGAQVAAMTQVHYRAHILNDQEHEHHKLAGA